jgi:hypothetical protein
MKWKLVAISLAFMVLGAMILSLVLLPANNVKAIQPTPTPGKTLLRLGASELEESPPGEVGSGDVSPMDQQIYYSTADAEVLQGYPTSNYGASSDMRVGYDDYLNPDGQIVRGLVRFDLSSLPTGATIDSATLRVYLVASWDYPDYTRTCTAYRIPSDWSESTVTWDNAPSPAEAYGSTGVTHGVWGWYSFDVTDLVRAWYNGTYTNRGIMLRGPEYSGTDSSWKAFSTKEGSYQPQLVVDYTVSSGPIVTSITPNNGQQGTVVHITNLAGSNFQSGAAVKLVKTGETDINATNVVVVSASQITCDLDLSGAATGQWDVVVTNLDMQSVTLSNGFTVEVMEEDTWYAYLPLVLKNYPGKYAVIVGVADYQYINDLDYTDDDAQDFYNTLVNQCGFQSDDIKLLTDSQATKSAIQDAITNWLDSREGAGSLVVIFFSGHGGNDMPDANGDETYGDDEYICPYNSSLYSWAYDISDDQLDTWLSALESQNIVVFIDSCFSGGMIRGPQDAVSRGINKATGEPGAAEASAEGDGFARDVNKPGRVVLTASSDTQLSWEFGLLQNGAFTYYLVAGLQSSSADTSGNGMVSAEEAYSYLQDRVDNYVYPRTGWHQDPQLYDGVSGDVDLSQP